MKDKSKKKFVPNIQECKHCKKRLLVKGPLWILPKHKCTK